MKRSWDYLKWPVNEVLRLLFALSLTFCLSAYGAQKLILHTDDGPPHMIQSINGGIDIDITREVLVSLGYQVEVEYASLARSKMSVINGMADVTVPTFYQQDENNFYLSDAVVNYRPTVFSLKQDSYQLSSLNDINSLSVATFQGATGYFGDDFVAMSKRNNYREIHDMAVLPKLLSLNRVDLVVLDFYIFYYYARQTVKTDQINEFNSHALISPVAASAGFNNSDLRDRFNLALKKYKTARKDQKVVERYIGHIE